MPSASNSNDRQRQLAAAESRERALAVPPRGSLSEESLWPSRVEGGCPAIPLAPKEGAQAQPLQYSAGLLLLSFFPAVARALYWKVAGVPESERMPAALKAAGCDFPERICRAFYLRDPQNIAAVLTHKAVLEKEPVQGLRACVTQGIVDSKVIMECARAALLTGNLAAHRRVHELVSNLPLAENERVELAMIAAQKQPFALVKCLHLYEPLSPDSRKEIARAALYHDSDGRPARSCLVALEPAKNFDYETRVELGLTLASRNPYGLARDFEVLGIENEANPEQAQRDRRRLAFAAAGASGPVFFDDCRRTIAAHVWNFGVTAREDLARLAVLCAGVSGGDTARYFGSFGPLHEAERFAVAMEAASSRDGAGAFVSSIRNFRIDNAAMLRAIGMRHAQSYGWQGADFLASFRFETVAQRRELALATVDAFGLPSQDSPAYPEIALSGPDRAKSYRGFLADHGFETLEKVFKELYPRAATARAVTAVRALEDLGVPLADQFELLQTVLRATPEGLREVIQEFPDLFWGIPDEGQEAAFQERKARGGWKGPFEEMLRSLIVPTLNSIQAEWHRTRSPALLKDVQNVFDGLINCRDTLPLNLPDSALRNGRLEAMIFILKQLESNRYVKLDRPVTEWDLFDTGISTVAQPLAFAAYFLTGPLFGDGTEASVVRDGLRYAFDMPNLPARELSGDQLGRLYETFASAESVRGLKLAHTFEIGADVWKNSFGAALDLITASSVVAKLRQPTQQQESLRVESENLPRVQRALAEQAQDEFRRHFALECGDGVMELQKEWGDLSPLMVLLARFKGGRSQEVPVLREVVRNVLAGTFHDWKYSSEHEQLRSMSTAQVAAWRGNPQSAIFVSAHDASKVSEEMQLADARCILERNLLQHIPDTHARRRLAFNPSIDEALRRSELSEKDFSQEVESLLSVTRDVEVLLEFGERAALQRYLKRFNSAKRGIASELPELASFQVRKDLSSILNAVRERSVETARRYLIFTCITDDPKLLIMVGDLVKTASCQSYKTGGMVETLPGYVMDSNIKVQLSFVVAEGKVRSALGLKRNAPLDVDALGMRLVPTRLALELRTPSGDQVEIDLGKAVSRRILRAGLRVNGREPIVMPEPRYQQQHAVTSLINAEADRQLGEFEQECGFEPCDGMLEFPASRNPGGVYSDQGGGAQLGPYRIWYKGQAKQ